MRKQVMKVPNALLGGAAFILAGRGRYSDVRSRRIDLSRYAGTWRILACTDNPVEKKFVDATETYVLADTNRLEVVLKWREESFTAPVKTHKLLGNIQKGSKNAVWKMKLFPLFAATYIIAEVSPDYSWAVVAQPSRKFGWLIARTSTVSDEIWARCMTLFREIGYDTSKFIKVPQPSAPAGPALRGHTEYPQRATGFY